MHAWGPVETQTDGTCNAALASAVGSKDHIQIGTWTKFNPVVGDEIPQLDANYRTRDEPGERSV